MRSKAVSALAALYERENLPPNLLLPPGELAMLPARGLEDLPARVQQHKRVPKK
ncbi:MAG: hypothetical protein K7J46_06460 [Bryobacter sp.]|nr:hypothetical protein [Bryobacter sp. CoA8 C33]